MVGRATDLAAAVNQAALKRWKCDGSAEVPGHLRERSKHSGQEKAGFLIVELRKGWFALKRGMQLASSHLEAKFYFFPRC